MQVIATVMPEQLAEMKRRGATPKQAAAGIRAEAERRYPGRTILLLPKPTGETDVVAL